MDVTKCPKRGMPTYVSNDQLLSDLRKQINYKERESQVRREEKLEEEKRFLDHVTMQLTMDSVNQRRETLKFLFCDMIYFYVIWLLIAMNRKQKDLLNSWEEECHLQNIKKLVPLGGEAVTKYLNSDNFQTSTLKKSGGRGGGVGFDSRRRK